MFKKKKKQNMNFHETDEQRKRTSKLAVAKAASVLSQYYYYYYCRFGNRGFHQMKSVVAFEVLRPSIARPARCVPNTEGDVVSYLSTR